MEDEAQEEAMLVGKLRDSRRRFQRRMQQLLEKYNRPFEDAPLVQMATLTYETPQGLRIWGGGLIKEMSTAQIQEFVVEPVDRMHGPVQATGKDLQSSEVDATLDLEDPGAGAVRPVVFQSPLRSEIRRKYLAQVDVPQSVMSCLQCAENGGGKDTHLALSPSLVLPANPVLEGCPSDVSKKSVGHPVESASSPRESDPSHSCSADMVEVSRNDSLWLPDTSGSSFLSSQSFEAEDMCDVTISDLYAGMLHSMSRLLSTKPSCTISTKTFINKNWNSRWRHKWKSRMNRTYCRAGRHSQKSSKKKTLPCSEPVKEVEVLRDTKNLLNASCTQTGSKLEKAVLEVNKPQIHKSDPSWEELRVTPHKSSLPYLDFSTVHHDDQENRLMTLKWLISPVKTVSKPRIQQGNRGNRYREIEVKFGKLHQEYCPIPGKQPLLTYLPGSLAVDVYRGGSGGSETHRLSITSPKRVNESLRNLEQRSLGGDRCLPQSSSHFTLSKTIAAQSTSHFEVTPDSLFQGGNPGIVRELLSPSKIISKAEIQPLASGRNYNQIKEKFDMLHQKYCHKSPQQPKRPLYIGQSPNKASTEVQYKKGDLGKFNLEPCLQGSQKLSPHWSIRSPLGPTPVTGLPSVRIAPAGSRDRQSSVKRRRLSDPQVCRWCTDSWNPSSAVGRASPRPREEVGCALQPGLEDKKRKEDLLFQDGREK